MMRIVRMRYWQHLGIGAFIAYIAFVVTVTSGGIMERASPVGSTVCLLLMILLPFILGPAAAFALIADIRVRWTDPAKRNRWLWLCLLLWPVGLYYYLAHGFRKPPIGAVPPPLPHGVSNAASAAASLPPSPTVMDKSNAAGRSLLWGSISMASPIVPLVLPACLVGIIYGHKGLLEIKESKGLLNNRGAAVCGLCLSYGSLVLTGMMMMFWINAISSIRQEKARNAPENLIGAPGYDAAREAEQRMNSFVTRGGDGNNSAARQLASSISQGIVRVQELNYVRSSAASKTRVDTPPFVYCHLEPDSCAVLIQLAIPVTLTPKDQDELYSVLWAELHDVVAYKKALKSGAQLALGIREHLNYKAIYLGEFHGAPKDEFEIPKFVNPAVVNGLETRRLFYSYFAAPPMPVDKATHPATGTSEVEVLK